MPREEIIYDLSDQEKICPQDGTILNEIGSEDHEQLETDPGTDQGLKTHPQENNTCPCCKTYVVTASKPKQAIEKSIAMPCRCIGRASCLNASALSWIALT